MSTISEEQAARLEDGPVLSADCKREVANSILHILETVGDDPQRAVARIEAEDVVARLLLLAGIALSATLGLTIVSTGLVRRSQDHPASAPLRVEGKVGAAQFVGDGPRHLRGQGGQAGDGPLVALGVAGDGPGVDPLGSRGDRVVPTPCRRGPRALRDQRRRRVRTRR